MQGWYLWHTCGQTDSNSVYVILPVQLHSIKISYHLVKNQCKLIIKLPTMRVFRSILNFVSLADRKFILRPKAANRCKREFPFPKALFHQEAQNNKKILQYEKWGISVQKNKSFIDSSTTVVNGLCFDPFCLSFSHVFKLLSTMSEGFLLKLFFISKGFY